MEIISKGFAAQPAFGALCGDIRKGNTPAAVVGLGGIQKTILADALAKTLERRIVYIVPDEAEAQRMLEDFAALGCRALWYPARDTALRRTESASREYEQMRIGTLIHLLEGDWDCLITCADAMSQFTMPPAVLKSRTAKIKVDEDYREEQLLQLLSRAGYERCEQVEAAGQFSVRGGIVDVFPADRTSPVRVEFWGDTVNTLTGFDVLSQRRTENIDLVKIPPAAEIMPDNWQRLSETVAEIAAEQKGKMADICRKNLQIDADRMQNGLFSGSADRYIPLIYDEATLFSYLGDALILVSEMGKVRDRFRASLELLNEEIKELLAEGELCRELTSFTIDEDRFVSELTRRDCLLTDTFSQSSHGFTLKALHHFTARQLPVWSGSIDLLVDDLQDFLKIGTSCIVLAGSEVKNARVLAEDLQKHDIPAVYAPHPESLLKRQVLVMTGGLSAGVAFPEANFAVITHGRMTSTVHKRRNRVEKKNAIHSIEELKSGDYIVHVSHGIAIYRGIHQIDVQGVVKDYLKLEYAKGDTLYVPVTQLDLVSKYIGTQEDAEVKLHRLGGQEWQKTKTRVRAAVKDIAKQLTELYGKRMSTPGYAFDPDGEWQYDFERHFEYQETDDQLRCIAEIKNDMERPVPMDRLLCGDVGFGKTEVALRAAFKCVAQGKQCVILVPTTILAFQHFNTLCKRFENFPVKIEMLSRFRNPKQQVEIVRKLRTGELDIVVGTHRLLSQDIKFRDLGLFVVDEEQRFGVAQKERIKELTPHVDVLTLSATPIPRTLNMAMSGVRDMSLIEEAPQDRRPVQTYVIEHDDAVITEAIRRELRRGGQVYYLHNRIENIEQLAAKLQRQIPEARIGFAHGKMTEEQLSEIWRQMLEQEIDILVCTTIIETGVDIANVNTLIIENADRFGLSQLHQIRGRVGRSSRRAFAYLTFRRGKELTEIATKRLEAIRDFTEFGAGFKIAMRDMEIRGAGNMLGAQQHGHMEAVGYEMYLQMLADAVGEAKGETVVSRERECLIDLRVSAHIPESYISANAQRLEIYRRIADIRTLDDSIDVYDEIIDRFGEPPAAVQGLIDVALMRNMAADLGIYEVKQQEDTLLLYMRVLDAELGSRISAKLKGRVLINASSKPYIAVKGNCKGGILDTLREALEAGMPEKKEETT